MKRTCTGYVGQIAYGFRTVSLSSILEWDIHFHQTFYFYLRSENPPQQVRNGTSISKRDTRFESVVFLPLISSVVKLSQMRTHVDGCNGSMVRL